MNITHTVCGTTSYNENDVRERYCGHCHRFLDKGEAIVEMTERESNIRVAKELVRRLRKVAGPDGQMAEPDKDEPAMILGGFWPPHTAGSIEGVCEQCRCAVSLTARTVEVLQGRTAETIILCPNCVLEVIRTGNLQ